MNAEILRRLNNSKSALQESAKIVLDAKKSLDKTGKNGQAALLASFQGILGSEKSSLPRKYIF